VRTLLSYAFGPLGLHRVELRVDHPNARAIRCYEKCGFRREGLQREDRRQTDGTYHHSIVMDILEEEFRP